MNYFRLRSHIFFSLLRYRLVQAATTRPTRQDWLLAVQLLLGYAAIVLPLGLSTGLVQFGTTDLTAIASFRLAARVLLFPALLEEGFWRVILLPHKNERVRDRKRWLIGLLVLWGFVLMHPLNGMTFYTAAFSTFTNPIFLISTTLLGLICMITYWRSGSWWVPVVVHWLVVFVWLMFCGGYGRLHG